MSPIRINFEGVEAGGQPWPVNEPIDFTIFGIQEKTGKDSGEPYLEFEFKQVGGNRKAWRNFSLQPQALWGLKQLLIDLGTDPEELEGELELDFDDLLGEQVQLYFSEPRDYQGKSRQDVSKVAVGS